MSAVSGKFIYETPWPSYALSWAWRKEPRMRLALGSFCEQDRNYIHVVEMNEDTKRLQKVAEVESAFPPTKLMWKPRESGVGSLCSDGSLLAASSSSLELFWLHEGQLKSVGKLPTGKGAPPLTSFDWSSVHENKIAASSVDTTCTIYDIEKMKIETALIAHDKAVYDIAFGQRESIASVFGSVGADGSVRFFDQRNLDHSTIIFETTPSTPLLRLSWNRNDKNYVATFASDTPGVIILDHRKPSIALKELPTHGPCVNAISWAPHSRNHLICGTEDGAAIIWDVREGGAGATAVGGLQYDAAYEVYQVEWPHTSSDHIALGTSRQLEVLRI